MKCLSSSSKEPISELGHYLIEWDEHLKPTTALTTRKGLKWKGGCQANFTESRVLVASLFDGLAVDRTGNFVEIGVGHAWGTATALRVMNTEKKKRHLISIDAYAGDVSTRRSHYGGEEANYRTAVRAYSGRIRTSLLKGFSQDKALIRRFRNSIDWLFVDGCHCYDCSFLDIENWAKKLVRGGILVVHDTSWLYRLGRRTYCPRLKQTLFSCTWPALQASPLLARDFELIRAEEGDGVLRYTGIRVYRRARRTKSEHVGFK